MKNSVFIICPHLDDLELSMWDTLIQYSTDLTTDSIYIYVLSSGLDGTSDKRTKIFNKNISRIKDISTCDICVKINPEKIDTLFNWCPFLKSRLEMEIKIDMDKLDSDINIIGIGIQGDKHVDHVYTESLTDIIFRPKGRITEYIKYFIPGSLDIKKGNLFIPMKNAKMKYNAIKQYNKINPGKNNLNRVKFIKRYDKLCGQYVQMKKVEVFNIVFKRENISGDYS